MNNSRPPFPNVTLRLLDRELTGHRGAPVHTARSFSECILPNTKVLEVESPDAHIGRFTPDGNHLVCFSLQLQAVLLFDYLGPTPQPQQNPTADAAALNPKATAAAAAAVGFSSFFTERWRLNLCDGSEQLNRDFCLTLCNGAYLLLASSTPVRRQGPAAAAAAAVGVDGSVAAVVSNETGAGQDVQQQQQRRGQQDAADTAAAAGGGERNARAASDDWCEMTTFHMVDLRRCMKVDERRYPSDYFELAGNACASLYDNILALTSLSSQSVHLLQVTAEGALRDMQTIGQMCQADDALPVQLAAAAEQQWQLQRRQQQEKEQQDKMEAASQQKLLLRMLEVQRQQQQQQQQGGTSNAGSDQQQQQQQVNLQQQLLQQVTHPNSLWGQAAAAAMGAAAVSGSTAAAAAAAAAAARRDSRPNDDDEDSSSDEETARRERRRRVPAGHQQQQQQNGRQQQQQQQPEPQHGPPTRASAAAASAAAAAALLDTQHQLIEGLQQRLLAYLYKSVLVQEANEVAPSVWDFQYNFGVFSGLVIFRARLLDCQHLLLKLAARTSGPASSAELNPNRVHFFAVYNIVTTRFEGFWKASNSRLLQSVMTQPSQLLAAGEDLSPWERCSAAALYPQGYPVGLGSSSSRQQQQQIGVETGDGSSRTVGRSTAAAAGRGARLQSGQQRQQAQAGSELVAGDAVVDAAAAAAGSSDSKAARDRLKLLRQVVLLVLPGLQNLSSSPYLDPHLFTYSKHISPIMGLRNSPTDSLKFKLARRYWRSDQQMQNIQAAQAEASSHGQEQQISQQQDMSSTERQQKNDIVLELDPARPHSVTWVNEEVARRQLHLFHPADPFVLTVVQTIAQPAVVSICYRS